MKPKWRSVAERAYNRAFGLDDISTAMMPALVSDYQDEITPRFIDSLRGICEQQETLLFKDDIQAQLEALQPEAGTGMGRHVLENVVRLSKQEEVSVFTAAKAIELTFVDRLAKSNRQMEEHTLRKSTASRTNDLRNRLEQATANARAKVAGLARQLLKLDNNRPARSISKRGGLDEGPSIR
jgi:hypothetical protein